MSAVHFPSPSRVSRVSIKITVYETTHKKYFDSVKRTVMTKGANSKFSKRAGGWSEANSRFNSKLEQDSLSVSASAEVNVAGSGGSASASMSESSTRATEEAVSRSVSNTWDNASSLSTSSENFTSTETEKSLEFQDGTSQIYALIKTTITIDGESVTNYEERFLTAGLTKHITADVADNDRLATWEKKAWRDFFHLEEVPAKSMVSYTLKLDSPVAKQEIQREIVAKTVFKQTQVGVNSFPDCRFITWAPGKWVYAGCSDKLYAIDKKYGYYYVLVGGTDAWSGIEAGACYKGKLYFVGSKKTLDKHNIYAVDLVTGDIKTFATLSQGFGAGGNMAAFNGKLYYSTSRVAKYLRYLDLPAGTPVDAVDATAVSKELSVSGELTKHVNLAAGPDGLYFTGANDGGIMKLNKSNMCFTLCQGGFSSEIAMCYSNEELYTSSIK